MLERLRADKLLAASVAGSLTGLRDVLSGAAPDPDTNASRAFAKAIGDAVEDVVYTPVTPCRLVETRSAFDAVYHGGGPFAPGEIRSYAIQSGNSVCNQQLPSGLHATAVQLQVFGIPANGISGDLEVLPWGAVFGSTATLVFASNVVVSSAAATVLVNSANNLIQVQARLGSADVAIDLVGYFKSASDATGMSLTANGQRLLRLENNAVSPNIIGGNPANSVTSGAAGATIVGGGALGAQITLGGFSYQCGASCANQVTDGFGVVGGGVANRAGDGSGSAEDTSFATVAGGFGSTASALGASVGGGMNNIASAGGATISGGASNVASGGSAAIGGGSYNVASGLYATIGGGVQNTASGFVATLSGGQKNIASGYWSALVGGEQNTASGEHAFVGGGIYNVASGQISTVGGGHQNNAAVFGATVAGGNLNYATGDTSFIGGGLENKASGQYATVGGGSGNRADAYSSTVSGGAGNWTMGDYGTVSGGVGNIAPGTAATIFGGAANYAAGDYSVVGGSNAKNSDSTHKGVFLFADASFLDFSSQRANEFAARATGGVRFITGIDATGAATAGTFIAPGSGTWSTLSDRASKRDFIAVDPIDVLDRVTKLPLYTWRYKAEADGVRHMGPVAQDFREAFGLGQDDKSIATIDADGVALASIQALHRKVRERDETIARQAALLEQLAKRVEALELR